MKIDASKTIREIVAEVPDSIPILRNFGIGLDRDDRPLNLACQAAGISLDDVVRSLEQGASPQQNHDAASWDEAAPSRLIAHIVEKHHTYCREEVTRLEQLLVLAVRKHGDRHPELRRIQAVFNKMGTDLKQHLLKEEQTLFQMILRMEEARSRQ